MIRQPIVVTVGHSDHGKTTLLDKIRGTAVTKLEPGLLTQHVGASYIPIETIKEICGELLDKFKIKIDIPGLLFIDTPGHAAFMTIRKRGSSIADLAILVIDMTEGIQEQTDESIKILKEFKTPFLVAATKIDRIEGWNQHKEKCFLDSFNEQSDWVKQNFDEKFYRLVGQLSERGFESERFDRINDFKKTVAIVPCSGITGEGIPDLLVMLAGLAQAFLKEQLEVSKGVGRGSILEVKEFRGLGTTIDVILYDGEIKKGDWMIVGGKEPIVTKIKALLKPRPLKELRVEKQFENIDYVFAADGVKISAPNLDNVISGSPVAFVSDENKIEEIKKELQAGIEEIEFEKEGEGVILKADNLGSLEALIGIFKDKVPIKKAEAGKVFRKDVIEINNVKDRLKKLIIAFNVGIDEPAAKEAKDKSIKIIQSNVIYQLVENYDLFIDEEKEKIKLEKLDTIVLPAKIKIIPGHTFRASKPAIVGVEVLAGTIKSGYKLKKDGKEVGEIKAIQSEGSAVEKASTGDKVAVSIEGPTVGRQIEEGEELTTIINEDTFNVLKELGMKDEIELAKEISSR
ncbi:translation initiation factor IF-2 [Candidatus Micrarchaeota archaeon RBG_16_36_9]|nr:MAG: translation initiation factor IF-2 [Candidatus Micrarchaeota archaeon RBG_16_36_9]